MSNTISNNLNRMNKECLEMTKVFKNKLYSINHIVIDHYINT